MDERTPNIAVVVLDTLRKDAFDAHFDWLEGVRYERAFAPSHYTPPVHASLFTGRYPTEVGVTAHGQCFDVAQPTLAEHLSSAGYTTRAFSTNTIVSPQFGFDRGFEEFTGNLLVQNLADDCFDWLSFVEESRGEGPSRYLRALYECLAHDSSTLQSLRRGLELKLDETWLSTSPNDKGITQAIEYVRSAPFESQGEFFFINIMETHGPYVPPSEYRSVEPVREEGIEMAHFGPKRDEAVVKQAYDDCARYLSRSYRTLYDLLTMEFDVVLTMADHGESFGEYGVWQHMFGIQPELTHVPLAVSVHDDEYEFENGTSRLTSLLDVYATVMDLAGIPIEDDMKAVSLRDPNPERKGCLLEYHGISQLAENRLYELGLEESAIDNYGEPRHGVATANGYAFERLDRDEVSQTGQSTVESPEELIDDLVATLDRQPTEREESDLDDEVIDQLKDLGYA